MSALQYSAGMVVQALRASAIAVVLVAPIVVAPQWRFFIFQIVAAAYLALSFDLSYSYAKILSFCQGIFFAVGAYAAIYLASSQPWGLPMVLGIAALGGVAIGTLLGAVLVRMDGHSPTIATVILAAAGLLIGNAFSKFTGGEDGLPLAVQAVGLGPLQLATGSSLGLYYVAAVPLLLLIVGSWTMQNHRFWKVLRAVAQNEARAQQLGFNVRVRRLVVFAVAAGLASIGGAFYGLLMGHVTTSVFDIALSVDAILWAVVGGLGNAFGPLIGVLIVYPVTEAIASVFVYVQIVVGAILVLVAVMFPKGVIGTLIESAMKAGETGDFKAPPPAASLGGVKIAQRVPERQNNG